jgi:hypothetical protein
MIAVVFSLLNSMPHPSYVVYSVALKKLHRSLMTGRTVPRSASVQFPAPPRVAGKAQGSMSWVVRVSCEGWWCGRRVK